MTVPVKVEEKGDDKDKMIFGEGAGFVVLETEQHALARNAKIYAEVLGEYSCCDSLCNEVIWERDAADLSYTMQRALESSDVAIDEIDFIVGASCLPWQLSFYEMPAIREIWKDIPVKYTTVKSRIGESFSAAPPISLSVAAVALYNRQIPSSGWKTQSETPVVVMDNIPDSTAAYCIVNSIKLGGNTTAIVMKTYAN
jgi:3-oxoacyl-[acyl-carrier-protein] synthase II